ncbi:hypothetical protein [Corynebacterium sp.]|uniref:hypothetical protein n=1 Tax=Corynebacterium sp. TaxID=1720 RepID=UPI0026DF93BF|nr:hypothetical protein [Corynebacterium sp.]MDO5512980.1 hypothetical protein [Corynebacterium sp.]
MSPSARTQASVILGLGVLLAACSPPNEQPSDLKVDTATVFRATPATTTSAAAGPRPGVIECVGAPEFEPTSLALSCADDDDRLVGIDWESWTSTSATGTATRETRRQGRTERTRDVEVRLHDPVNSPQGLVYSRVTVDDDEVIF